MNKRFFLVFGLLFSFSFSLVSANFACGEIAFGNYSPAWETVSLNYLENPSLKTFCEVSPLNNRYCCDPRSISGVSWGIGKKLESRIIDPVGYFTDKVNLTISGEGFDVFPITELKKAIISEVEAKDFIINNGSLFFKFKSSYPFLLTNYTLIGDSTSNFENLCNCTNDSIIILGAQSGNYNLIVSATDGINTFYYSDNFTLLDFLNIDRTIDCKGCDSKRIPSNTEVFVHLSLVSSHQITSKLYDHFPRDWRYLGNESIELGRKYNLISWGVNNASSFNVTYSLRSPNYLSRKYQFVSLIGDFQFNPQIFYLYRFTQFMSFFAFKTYSFSENLENLDFVKNIRNGPSMPLVSYLENSLVSEFAIFYSEDVVNSEIYFGEIDKYSKNSVATFIILSNYFDFDKIESVYIKIKADGKFDSYKSFSLFLIEENNESPVQLKKTYDEDGYRYYEFIADKIGTYDLRGVV